MDAAEMDGSTPVKNGASARYLMHLGGIVAAAAVVAATAGACASPWEHTVAAATPPTRSGVVGATGYASTTLPADGQPGQAVPAPAAVGGSGAGAGSDLPPANALSPDDQAQYCKRTDPNQMTLPVVNGMREYAGNIRDMAKGWSGLLPFTPVALRSDVGTLATDYEALAEGSRTMPQVDTEIKVAYQRVMDYRNLICFTDEERPKPDDNPGGS